MLMVQTAELQNNANFDKLIYSLVHSVNIELIKVI